MYRLNIYDFIYLYYDYYLYLCIFFRCHLPLVIPEGDCGMEIGGKTVKWEVGKPLFFDDCYEHKGKLTYTNLYLRLIYFYLH